MLFDLVFLHDDHGPDAISHLTIGWLPLLAFAVSFAGWLVGFACVHQVTIADTARRRNRWTVMAAITIGGVAIWLMHFLAMMGMTVEGSPVRFDVGLTIVSALLAIVATYGALVFIGHTVRPVRLVIAGVTMGIAVALMHYVGVFAMRIQGDIEFVPTMVALSVVIAVVGSTAALWAALMTKSFGARLLAAFIVAIAVCGMHYTGMYGMEMHVDPSLPVPEGIEVFSFLFPVFVFSIAALAIPIVAVTLNPESGEVRDDDESWLENETVRTQE